jgi:hypothetical protein
MMDQDKFIEQFEATFLATWAANKISLGIPQSVAVYDWLKDAPVMEARMIARHMWYEMVRKFGPPVPWR